MKDPDPFEIPTDAQELDAWADRVIALLRSHSSQDRISEAEVRAFVAARKDGRKAGRDALPPERSLGSRAWRVFGTVLVFSPQLIIGIAGVCQGSRMGISLGLLGFAYFAQFMAGGHPPVPHQTDRQMVWQWVAILLAGVGLIVLSGVGAPPGYQH